MIYSQIWNSPIGKLIISADEHFLTQVSFYDDINCNNIIESNKIIYDTIEQLDKFFLCKLQKFNLPLKLEGTLFQKAVWSQLLNIPYGKTASYSEIASKIDKPKASRAVGNANHFNPIVIIVPCHRIVHKTGGLGGYGGGLERKKFLLDLETNA